MDKAFVSDICRAPVSGTEMDQAVLDRVIAAHLFQQVRIQGTAKCFSCLLTHAFAPAHVWLPDMLYIFYSRHGYEWCDAETVQILLLQGRFEIGDAFAREAALECEDSLKRPFEHMHMVLQQVLPRPP